MHRTHLEPHEKCIYSYHGCQQTLVQRAIAALNNCSDRSFYSRLPGLRTLKRCNASGAFLLMLDTDEWIEAYRGEIRILADESYLTRVWVRGEGPEVDSIEEFCCRWFDDLAFENFLTDPHVRGRLAPRVFRAIEVLGDRLDRFDFKPAKTNEEIVHCPDWQEIIIMAKRALSELERAGKG